MADSAGADGEPNRPVELDSTRQDQSAPTAVVETIEPVESIEPISLAEGAPDSPAKTAAAALPEVEVSIVGPGGPLATPTPAHPDQGAVAAQAAETDTASSSFDYFTTAYASSAVGPTAASSQQPSSLAHESRAFVDAARRDLYGPQGVQLAFASTEPKLWEPPAPYRYRPRNPPQRSLTEYPKFPNQAFAALHDQAHPTAPRLARSLHPAAATRPPPSSAGISPAPLSQDDTAIARIAKTTSNTPAHSPGLFTLPKPLAVIGFESRGENSPYPSPYLHPSQLVPPKTVKTAERNVDTYSGHKLINHYEVLEELGRGVHGKVKLARDLESGEYVAIKFIRRYPKRRRLGRPNNPEEKVRREIAILKKVQHPNVVRMIEVIDDPEDKQVYIVLEFCELKEISWRTRGTSEIIILEHRRVEREKQGIPDSTAVAQNEKVLQAAARRRERQERVERQANKRSKSESDFWSLEYAGDSDDDMDGSGVSDKSSSANDEGSQGDAASRTNSNEAQQPSRSGSSTKFSVQDEYMHRSPESAFGDYTLWGEVYWPHQPRSAVDLVRGSTVDLLAFDESRGRQPSLTDSVSSRLTELVEEQMLEDERYVPTMTIPECRMAFRDALVGLEFLHYHNIVHRDIKPENLLRTRDHRVKISDFGVSYLGKHTREGAESAEASESEAPDIQDEAELAKTVGTPGFYAPELCYLDLEGDPPQVTAQIDVWALGVTLFCMLFARLPYSAKDMFTLIKHIREDAVFIPHLRLKAVDSRPGSRSQSHGPLFRQTREKRLPSEWTHEPVDGDLYDLLSRLLQKDPDKRITIKDIKSHPWVLAGLSDPDAWLAETEPSRLGQGTKIKPTQEEVRDAFKPINVIERVRSIANRAGKALGLGGSKSRRRGQSSASSSDAGASTTPPMPEPHTLGPKRAVSKHEDDAGKHAKAREGDHPLSRTVHASPDRAPADRLSKVVSQPGLWSPELAKAPLQLTEPLRRPSMPNRQASEMSTAASIRTIRQSDIDSERGRKQTPSPPLHDATHISPQLEPFPDPPATSGLGAIFGSAGRSIMRSVRSRERGSTDPKSPTLPSTAEGGSLEDLHGQASVAVSNTSAAGHVEKSRFLGLTSKKSPFGSRSSSRAAAPPPKEIPVRSNTDDGFYPARSASVDAGLASRGDALVAAVERMSSAREREVERMSSAQEWEAAQETLARRRALEDEMHQEELAAARPGTSSEEQACPLSPDDLESEGQQSASPVGVANAPAEYFPPTSAAGPASATVMQPVSSTSSEDYFASNMSQSTSINSIPSAVSADSSLSPASGSREDFKDDSANSSEGTARSHHSTSIPLRASLQRPSPGPDSDDGYVGDGDGNGYDVDSAAVELDSSDSDSDSDGDFLLMNSRNPSAPRSPGRNGSRNASASATPRLTRYRERRQTAEKKPRSGSANTMTKVSPEPAPAHTGGGA